jgi:hypothetical protein
MDSVGNGFEDSAFSVIDRHCATLAGKWSFPHELGHQMGARHDWAADNANNKPYPYNHGHTQPHPASGTAWRTIMAYEGACGSVTCPRVMNWSNPNISVGGSTTGTATGAQQEDNHRTLNNTALTMANFRCSSPGREDVWMKDTWSDTGREPDPAQASLPMWESPYIWVQNASDTQLIHQHEHQNPIKGQPNFIYVKLHNGGPVAAGNLELYLADASVGLTWPSDWTLVATVPLSIAAHTTQIAEAQWTPTATGHHCLIARWVSASDPMTVPETSDINANVRGNNNIIWRNLNIVDLGADADVAASFLVRTGDRVAPTALTVQPAPPRRNQVSPPRPTFLDFGQIMLRLDDRLLAAWQRNGFAGSGFRRSGNIVTLVNRKGAVLEFGRLPANFKVPVDIRFLRPKDRPYPHDDFLIRVFQGSGPNAAQAIGGVSYEVRTAGF